MCPGIDRLGGGIPRVTQPGRGGDGTPIKKVIHDQRSHCGRTEGQSPPAAIRYGRVRQKVGRDRWEL